MMVGMALTVQHAARWNVRSKSARKPQFEKFMAAR